jgi:hypothetical protein
MMEEADTQPSLVSLTIIGGWKSVRPQRCDMRQLASAVLAGLDRRDRAGNDGKHGALMCAARGLR